jgi:integrase
MYEISFQKYLDFMGNNDLFCQNNPKLVEAKIIEFIMSLRGEGKSYAAILNYLNSVKGFYKINDVMLNSHKINKFMPEQIKVKKDRAYTHEEISKVLDVADERMKVVILLLASSGIRLGAIPAIGLRNLEDNKLTVYENTREEYITFITPECKKALDFYLDTRSRYGEKLTDSSYLIREQFDIRDQIAIRSPKQVTHKLIQWKLMSLAEKCGIRKRGSDKSSRQDIMIAHGFRKFFTTQLVNSKINPEIREMLLGHKIGLTSCYYKPSIDEMYSEYEKGIDNLTINPANRLQRKIETLTIEKSRLDRIEEKMLKMEQMYQK